MKKNKYNIAIVGLGNIGLNLYKHLIQNKKSIKKKTNSDLNIKYVFGANLSLHLPLHVNNGSPALGS